MVIDRASSTRISSLACNNIIRYQISRILINSFVFIHADCEDLPPATHFLRVLFNRANSLCQILVFRQDNMSADTAVPGLSIHVTAHPPVWAPWTVQRDVRRHALVIDDVEVEGKAGERRCLMTADHMTGWVSFWAIIGEVSCFLVMQFLVE